MALRLGKRHIEVLSQFIGSAGFYGATSFATLCYFTDWKVVVTYIPYYNGKFKQEE